MTHRLLVGLFFVASAVACSTAEDAPAGTAGDDQNLTAAQTSCQTSADCVAVQTLPCCSSKKTAVNKSAEREVTEKAQQLCLVAACAPDFDPDNRVAACQANKCVMVDQAVPHPDLNRKVAGFDFTGFKIA